MFSDACSTAAAATSCAARHRSRHSGRDVKIGGFFSSKQFKTHLAHAYTYTQEIVGPVVERAVSIAAIATRELAAKDFATEANLARLRRAAHLVSMPRRSLSLSLSLRVLLLLNVKFLFLRPLSLSPPHSPDVAKSRRQSCVGHVQRAAAHRDRVKFQDCHSMRVDSIRLLQTQQN